MSMDITKVGRFTLNPTTGEIAGPAEYMNSEQYARRIERIYAGQDPVFEMGLQRSPNAATALLVAIQTDYAAWKGQQQIAAMSR